MNARLSVCIPALYPDIPVAEGIRRAARFGAEAVEIWSWWDQDIPAIRKALDETGCRMAALCTPFISLVDRGALDAYLKGLSGTISVCKELNCKRIISQVGNKLDNISGEEQHAQLVRGLRAASALLDETEITLAVEPLNTKVDHPGYYLYSSDECADILREVEHPRIRMLFDIYHQQIMEGDIITRLTRYQPLIAHIHMAAVPGRGRLNDGELNYEHILRYLDGKGYRGYAAIELFCNEPDDEIRQWSAFMH